jgi:glycolate oxidase iron-sulfur subunit
MVLVEQEQMPISEAFVGHIDKCLDCRACETACPSGVEYGKLVEHARARIEQDINVRSLLGSLAISYSRGFFPFRRGFDAPQIC